MACRSRLERLETAAGMTGLCWRDWCAREPERGRPRRTDMATPFHSRQGAGMRNGRLREM